MPGNARRSNQVAGRQPRSKKPQRACDRWYSLGVILSNRGGNSGLRSLTARHPPDPRLRCWNSASVILPADAGIPSGPISRCAVIPDGLPGIGLLNKGFVGLGAMATQPEIVEQLFESALALKPAQREAFLDQACSHDLELRRTVEELLAEDANAGSLLEHPPFELLGQERPPHVRGTTVTSGDNEVPSALPPAGRLMPGQVLINRFVILRFIAKEGWAKSMRRKTASCKACMSR